jgi:predicted nucleotidyltransferase
MTKNYDPFIQGWKRRLRLEQERTKQLISSALENAGRAAQILISEYGAKEVYLFGSLIHEENFSSRSDIDLAVTGLEPSYFYDAIGHILQEIEFDLNLISLETCKPSLRDRVLKEGRLLYG